MWALDILDLIVNGFDMQIQLCRSCRSKVTLWTYLVALLYGLVMYELDVNS
jgi:hypothetical protein